MQPIHYLNTESPYANDFSSLFESIFAEEELTVEYYRKRELSHVLINLSFSENEYVDTKDVEVSIDNLTALSKDIELYIFDKTPSIDTAIYESFASSINELIEDLKYKIERYIRQTTDYISTSTTKFVDNPDRTGITYCFTKKMPSEFFR